MSDHMAEPGGGPPLPAGELPRGSSRFRNKCSTAHISFRTYIPIQKRLTALQFSRPPSRKGEYECPTTHCSMNWNGRRNTSPNSLLTSPRSEERRVGKEC